MIRHYELLYLVTANYTEEELVPIKEKIKKIIEKSSGQITAEDSLGKKKLAYPIKSNHQGYYLIYEFDLDGDNLKELERNLKLTNELLRHVIVKRVIKAPTILKTTEEKIRKIQTKSEEEKVLKKLDEKSKIKLEDLDQKLDEILEGNIL